jgi:BASS family bile acid:Na+ symporter
MLHVCALTRARPPPIHAIPFLARIKGDAIAVLLKSAHGLLAALAWLGRQGTRAIAVSIFVGLSLPQLAAALKPFVGETIFLLLVLAFLRTEPRQLRAYFVRPGLIAAATIWMMVITPAVAGASLLAFGLHESSPGLYLAFILQASAAPIMSAPAFFALLGLDATLSLAVLMTCMLVTPLTAPFFAYLFAGSALSISAFALALRLGFLLGGSAAAGWIVRRAAGAAWIERHRDHIDGANALLLLAFAIAVMDGVAAAFRERPLFILGLVLVSFAIALAMMVLTALAFSRSGVNRAFALAHAAGNRNMGMMLAATGGALPDLTWLYMGLAQFPIYLLPYLLQPLARRMRGQDKPE